jgi:hypothetical protein
MKHVLVFATMTAIGLALVLPTDSAVAQQKQHVSYKVTAENAKYTQQQFLDVGDVPGHQVRIFEIYRTFPTNAPVINGIKLKEQWVRAFSDYIDNNGTTINYSVFVLENGDKFFSHTSGVSQTPGSGKLTNMTAGHITGGTGKLAGIQGIIRSTGSADIKAGLNETQTEIEYSIGN